MKNEKGNAKVMVIISIIIILIIAVILILINNKNMNIFNKNKENSSNVQLEKNNEFMMYVGEDESNYKYIDKNGNLRNISKEIYKLSAGYRNVVNNSLVVYKDGNKTLINGDGQEIVGAEKYKNIDRIDYDSSTICSSFYEVCDDQYKRGVIDEKGNIVVPTKYEKIWSYSIDQDEKVFQAVIDEYSGKCDLYWNENKVLENEQIDISTSSENYLARLNDNVIVFNYFNETDGDVPNLIILSNRKDITKINNVTISKTIKNRGSNYIILKKQNEDISKAYIFDDYGNIVKELQLNDDIYIKESLNNFCIIKEKDKYKIYKTSNKNIEEIYSTEEEITIENDDNDNIFFIQSQKYSNGKVTVLNSNLEKIVEVENSNISINNQHIFILNKANSMYTVYSYDGDVLLKDIEKCYNVANGGIYVATKEEKYIVKDDKKMQIGSNDNQNSIQCITLKNNNYELIKYSNKIQIIDMNELKVTWETSEFNINTQIQDCNNIQLLNIENKYYDYNGNLIFENKEK